MAAAAAIQALSTRSSRHLARKGRPDLELSKLLIVNVHQPPDADGKAGQTDIIKDVAGILGLLPHDGARSLSINKIIRRVAEPEEQQAYTYRYWQSLSVGERLSATWDVSAAAYAFAAAFEGAPPNDARRPQRTITRIQRSRR